MKNRDLGIQAVELLKRRYQVEDQWCVERERGWTWWLGDVAQHAWAEPALDDEGTKVWRVHVRTDVFRGYAATAKQKALLQMSMHLATLSGFARSPEDPARLQLAASVYVHEDNHEWVGNLLAWAGLIQAVEAHVLGENAEGLGAFEADRTGHPRSGPRRAADEMLGAVESIVRPLGKQQSKWTGPDMKKCLEFTEGPPCVVADGGRTGVTAEYPFGTRTSLLQFVGDSENPRFGNGLLTLLTIPRAAEDPQVALEMNDIELRQLTRSHFLGSWCPHKTGLTFCGFYPNAAYADGLLPNVLTSSVMRARWLAEDVLGQPWAETYDKACENKLAMMKALGSPSSKPGLLSRLFGSR